jgi:dolichol-phosphate mannosyltransferase
MSPRVTVGIPLCDEEQGIAALLARVGAVLDGVPGGPHEIVLVDDGSSDRTLALAEAAAARDERVVVVALSRNFGHQAALTAALDHAAGDVIVVMDGDLQDPPEAIPRFLEEHAKGADVVYARRTNRKEAWWLRGAYYLFYRLLDRLSTLKLPLDSGDFGLMSRRVADVIKRVPERNRFLRGLRAWAGFKQVAVDVERSERHSGRSKYSLRKLLRLAFDGMFAFSTVPIRAAAILGAIAIGLSVVFAVYSVFAKLVLNDGTRGFTALTLLITFLSGVNLFFLGVIGEYVGRVYEEVKGRPVYVVSRVTRRSAAPGRTAPARHESTQVGSASAGGSG